MSTHLAGPPARRLWLALPLLVACGSSDSDSLGTTTNPAVGGASGTGGTTLTGGQAGQGAGGTAAASAGTTSAGTAGTGPSAGSTGGGAGGVAGASIQTPAPSSLVSRNEHTCARLADGRITCWGYNVYGQLGLGDTVDRGDAPGELGASLAPISLGAGATIAAVTTGFAHTCTLLTDGRVKCWGGSPFGAVGLDSIQLEGDEPGEVGGALPAVDLGSDARVVDIASGNNHVCAVFDTGQVKCWGHNQSGALGLGDTNARGDEPGEMGDALPFVDLGSGARATRLVAGSVHTCALLEGGQVKCWGCQTFGQLGLGDIDPRGKGPGEMGDALLFVDLGTGLAATDIAAGYQHTCVRLTTGQVKCWGLNYHGELGLGDTTERGRQPGQMGDGLPAVELSSAVAP